MKAKGREGGARHTTKGDEGKGKHPYDDEARRNRRGKARWAAASPSPPPTSPPAPCAPPHTQRPSRRRPPLPWRQYTRRRGTAAVCSDRDGAPRQDSRPVSAGGGGGQAQWGKVGVGGGNGGGRRLAGVGGRECEPLGWPDSARGIGTVTEGNIWSSPLPAKSSVTLDLNSERKVPVQALNALGHVESTQVIFRSRERGHNPPYHLRPTLERIVGSLQILGKCRGAPGKELGPPPGALGGSGEYCKRTAWLTQQRRRRDTDLSPSSRD